MSVPQSAMQRPMPSLDYGVGAAIALLVAGLIGFGLAQAGSVPMQVDLYGDLGLVEPADVHDIAAPMLGGGFFQFSSDSLERRVQSLPWVRDVQVERLWPDRVAVHIQTHKVMALWGQYGVLTMDGELITPDQLPEVALQIVAPDQRAAEVFADLSLVLPSLPANWQLRRWELSTTGDRQAVIELEGHDITLEFGREPVAGKFRLLADVALPVLAPRLDEVDAVDLRYRNGFAVRWRKDKQVNTNG